MGPMLLHSETWIHSIYLPLRMIRETRQRMLLFSTTLICKNIIANGFIDFGALQKPSTCIVGLGRCLTKVEIVPPWCPKIQQSKCLILNIGVPP